MKMFVNGILCPYQILHEKSVLMDYYFSECLRAFLLHPDVVILGSPQHLVEQV